ncbi:MAG TPA: M14 family zinc carboxypeptidase [Thermoguttaceae bacterium]|nr:M14 family zinc carboxypeptidase [Thermoguttaceae bacterium]
MSQQISQMITRGYWLALAATLATMALIDADVAAAGELSADDFRFDGPLGSQGARIDEVGENHFKIRLGHAPEQPTWCNMLYFQIVRDAEGNKLRLDVEFQGGDAYRFNHNSATWSYDAENWRAIRWCDPDQPTERGDSLLFPEFSEDVIFFGAQVPLSFERIEALIGRWARHPHVAVHVIGKSLGGRKLYRLEITDPESPHRKTSRWVHWFGNQHPGEHNAQWRIVGMIDWLLSDDGDDFRRRSVCHFVPMTSPDGPSSGWYRVNAQGVDMNRSYFSSGADEEDQAHEVYVVQRDLERLMASDSPVTSLWSMHTWSGPVEPILVPGPEVGSTIGPWEEFREVLLKNDPRRLVEPLKTRDKPKGAKTTWNEGPHVQFGISNVLCEGSGGWTSKEDCLEAGAVLMRSISEYYAGTKPSPNEHSQ